MENNNNKQNKIVKKEQFTKPEIEIIKFGLTDIICTSGFIGDFDEEL